MGHAFCVIYEEVRELSHGCKERLSTRLRTHILRGDKTCENLAWSITVHRVPTLWTGCWRQGTPGLAGSVEVLAVLALHAQQSRSLLLLAHYLLVFVPWPCTCSIKGVKEASGHSGFADVHGAASCQDSALSQSFLYCTKAIRSILTDFRVQFHCANVRLTQLDTQMRKPQQLKHITTLQEKSVPPGSPDPGLCIACCCCC